jgi:glycosyltransferase involved in cell wall biosynthesis
MRICYQGFAAQNHSWAIVAQNICRSLIDLNHSVDIFSTNGNKYFPQDLEKNLVCYGDNNKVMFGNIPGNNYDMTISYTAMKNFNPYLQHSAKNRFGIYCYEFAGKNSLPVGFAKAHQYCDKILAPSNFARQVFLESGVPDDKVVVIPHGINNKEIDAAVPYQLKTKKSVKILINLGQIHRRKNFTGALEMFGRAFTKESDVCLVLKIQDRTPTQQFELSFKDVFQNFNSKFPNHAEVEIVKEFIPNIYSLYKACDITFSPSHCEGFGMVPLEGMACGLIPVASNYGGFTDFLDHSNAFLIEGKEFNVPPNYLYYQSKPGTKAFMPDPSDGINKLKAAVASVNSRSFSPTAIKLNYDWLEVAKKVLALVK